MQIGQIVQQLVDQQESKLQVNTIINPKEQRKAITTRQESLTGKGIGDDLRQEEKGEENELEKQQNEIEKLRENLKEKKISVSLSQKNREKKKYRVNAQAVTRG